MPFLATDDGCEIYYECHGSGPTIAFISGFMGITDIWRRQIEALSPAYQCVAFDTRGAGRSDKPLPRVAYGVERHARDLAAVLDAVAANRVALVGHSMGGNIAARYYLAHPRAVAGIVFVGSYVAGSQIAESGNTLARIKAAIKTKQDRVDFFAAVGLSADLAMESATWPLYAIIGNAESFMAFDLTAEIGMIKVPSLVVHGDRDIVSPLEPCGTALAAGLPDAELAVFPGVNHCPMTEDPDKTNEVLRRFLDTRVRW